MRWRAQRGARAGGRGANLVFLEKPPSSERASALLHGPHGPPRPRATARRPSAVQDGSPLGARPWVTLWAGPDGPDLASSPHDPSSSVASSSPTLGADPARHGAPLSSTQRVPALCGAAQRRGAALHPRDALPPPLSTYATPSRPPARRGAPPSPTQPRRLHGNATLLRDALVRPRRRGAARRGAALHLLVARPPCAARRSTYSTVARPRAARRFTYVSVAYTGTRPAMTPRRCSVTL